MSAGDGNVVLCLVVGQDRCWLNNCCSVVTQKVAAGILGGYLGWEGSSCVFAGIYRLYRLRADRSRLARSMPVLRLNPY